VGDQALLSASLFSPPRLILITDSARLQREVFFDVVDAALRGGVDAVLVREKGMDSSRLLAFASRLRAMTREHGVRLIVHTQADVAHAVAADGVHVAAASVGEIPAMRRWLNDAGLSISASCHSADELQQAAAAGADFALLSPVFPTDSHPGAPCLGIEAFHELAEASPLPVVALGGITPQNRGELAAYGVAVIGAILNASEPEKAARALL
jgi:thiamine-phosphate pyrophosphorylase